MTRDTALPFCFPSVRGKTLAAAISDPRDPTRVRHPLAQILLARIPAVGCGYEDADDLT